jgi:hypothetical protein
MTDDNNSDIEARRWWRLRNGTVTAATRANCFWLDGGSAGEMEP